MRVLTDLIFDKHLNDTDKSVFIGLHYVCCGKKKHTIELEKVHRFIGMEKPNLIRSINKFKDNKNYIVSWEKINKSTEYEFVLPTNNIAFESIEDEHLEVLIKYPKYLILFLKIKHINWQLEQDRKKEDPQFTSEVKALRYYGLDIDDFESTMEFLQQIGIVSTYEVKLSAQLSNGEIIFNNINKTNEVVVEKPKTKPTPKVKKEKVVVEQPKENAKTILTLYYDKVNGTSTNFPKEVKLVDNLLKKTSIEEMKEFIEWMAKNSKEIAKINYAYDDYNKLKQITKQLDEQGTAPYLLKKYYTGLQLPPNKSTMIKEVEKIQSQINADGYETTEKIINFMIQQKTPSINFITTVRNDALKGKTTSKTIDDNPCFREKPKQQNEADYFIVEELRYARSKTLKDYIGTDDYEPLLEECKKAFIEKTFDVNNYSQLEWAYKIKLPLTKELFAKVQDENEVIRYVKQKDDFLNWVKKQKEQLKGE